MILLRKLSYCCLHFDLKYAIYILIAFIFGFYLKHIYKCKRMNSVNRIKNKQEFFNIKKTSQNH